MPQTLNLLLCLRQNVSNEMIENEEPCPFQADSQDSPGYERNGSAAMIVG